MIVDVWEVLLSGKGGQGLITASIILADAAVKSGKNVVQSQSYGPESRGGACKAQVIISDGEILYPRIKQPNLLFCMSDAAFDALFPTLSEGGMLVLDDTMVSRECSIKSPCYRVPITDITREKLGQDINANIIALGVIVGITQMVPETAMTEALKSFFSSEGLAASLQAFAIGLEEGKKAAGQCGEYSA